MWCSSRSPPLFFSTGAGLSLGAAIFRACLPESEYFLRAKARGSTGVSEATVSRMLAGVHALTWVDWLVHQGKSKQFMKEVGAHIFFKPSC